MNMVSMERVDSLNVLNSSFSPHEPHNKKIVFKLYSLSYLRENYYYDKGKKMGSFQSMPPRGPRLII